MIIIIMMMIYIYIYIYIYSDIENVVRDATTNEKIGLQQNAIERIAREANNPLNMLQAMDMLWHRLNDRRYNIHVLKALDLVHGLLSDKRTQAQVARACEAKKSDIKALLSWHEGMLHIHHGYL